MSGAIETSDIVTHAELAALEAAWWSLWERCEPASVFQTPAWLIPWWRSFEPGLLRTVAAWRGERLVGLSPFYLEEASGRLLPVGIAASDHLDVLVDPADEESGAALVRHTGAQDWDAWCLEELRPGAAALRLGFPARWTLERDAQSACPSLDLAGDGRWPDAVPKRRRDQVRHALNAARRRGGVEIAGVSDPAAFLGALQRLHNARWAVRNETGVMAEERLMRFHEEAARRLGAAGLMRAFTLAIAGETAACHYGFVAKGEASYYIGGFDPRFARQSPGTILVGHAIEEAKAEGCRSFSFLRGREDYKYGWGALDHWNERLVVLRG